MIMIRRGTRPPRPRRQLREFAGTVREDFLKSIY